MSCHIDMDQQGWDYFLKENLPNLYKKYNFLVAKIDN